MLSAVGVCVGEEWEGRRKEDVKSREEIALGTSIRLWLIRE